MNKEKIYRFSIKLKKLLEKQQIVETIDEINSKDLSKVELDFLFMCLHNDGYDVKTDSFIFYESDNSAFLSLVNLVQNKVSEKK